MLRSTRRTEAGTSPGTLQPVPSSSPPRIHAFSYGKDDVEEVADATLEDIARLRGARESLWVNVDGLGDIEVLRAIGALFGVHELALEDVLAIHHRAKAERFADQLFLVLRMPEIEEDGLRTDQLSIFEGANYVLTFQAIPGDCFERVRARIRSGRGRIRSSGPGYLVYALLDAVIDSYYPTLEEIGERLEDLEDTVLTTPTRALSAEIHRVRRDLLLLRRAIWPLREILNDMSRREDAQPALAPYLRDCYDHVVELVDMIETCRDLAAGLMEVFVSIVGNRMNEIMKVLTIIATIFMPLSFIASVYGMNFDPALSPLSMPELRSRYGYVAVLGLMAAVAITMLAWFWRRGWLRGDGFVSDSQPRPRD